VREAAAAGGERPVARSRSLRRGEVELSCLDYGGDGPPVLLLHGLAGHAGEWLETARRLTERHRVLALDLRGHGLSTTRPADISPEAHAADVAAAIEAFAVAPVALVGQSLGANLALLTAALHPQLVRALVVAEGYPGADPQGTAAASIERWLASWPRPFASRRDAVAFFGGGPRGEAWADGLAERDGSLWPRFDAAVLVGTLREALRVDRWAEWESIACPALAVRAANGYFDAATIRAMAARGRDCAYAEVADAGHDLHLEQPAGWIAAIGPFLARA
jgi:pimeloyl-ACP methyl ester carboxylesterase